MNESELENQNALSTVAAVMDDALSPRTVRALLKSDYLRARVRYLLNSIAASGHLSRIELVLERAHVSRLLEYIGRNAPTIGNAFQEAASGPTQLGYAAISSARVEHDTFRTPWQTPGWDMDDAGNRMERLLNAETALDEDEHIALDVSEHIIVASPEIPVEVGTAPSVGVGQQEFIYVNLNVSKSTEDKSAEDRYGTVPWEARTGTSEARSEGSKTAEIDDSNRSGLNGYDDHTIAIFVEIHYGSGKWVVHPVPGHVRWLDRPTRLLASVNVLGLLSQLAAGRDPKVCFFLSEWRPDE